MGVGTGAPSAMLLQPCAELRVQCEHRARAANASSGAEKTHRRNIFKVGKERIGEAHKIILIIGQNA